MINGTDFPEQPKPTGPYHPNSLTDFSEEFLLLILFYLDIPSLGRVAAVCKILERISQDNQLWHRFLHFDPDENLQNVTKGILKEKVKNQNREFFKLLKIKYLEKYKPDFTTPKSSYKKGFRNRSLWDDFVKITKIGTKKDWDDFTNKNGINIFEKATMGFEDFQNLLLAGMKNSNYPEVLKATIIFLNRKVGIPSDFIEFPSFRWIMLKCFEQQCPPLLVDRVHPIFAAIKENNAEIVEFFIAYHPASLEERDNLEVPRTPIQRAFIKDLKKDSNKELALSLVRPSYLQNEKLLDQSVLLAFLTIHSYLDSKTFLGYLKLFDLKTFRDTFFTFVSNFFLDCDINSEKFSSLLEFAKGIINFQSMFDGNETILHKSVTHGKFELCKVLLKNGANPNLVNKNKNSPLHMSIKLGKFGLGKVLLENGADPNLVDKHDNTPLHYLVSSNFLPELEAKALDFLSLLISTYKANLRIANAEKNTAIDVTIEKNKIFYFKNLLEFTKENINAQDMFHNNETLLHKSIKLNRFEFCKVLLENGADSNLVDKDGNTVLHLLINNADKFSDETENQLKDFLPMLINTYKADFTIPNKAQKTFIQIALEKNQTLILSILIKKFGCAQFISEQDVRQHYRDRSKKSELVKQEKKSLFWDLRKHSVSKQEQSTQTTNDEHISSLFK